MTIIKKLRWYWKLFLEHRRVRKEALDEHIRRAHVDWFGNQVFTVPKGQYEINAVVYRQDGTSLDLSRRCTPKENEALDKIYFPQTAMNPSDSHCATTRDGGEVK